MIWTKSVTKTPAFFLLMKSASFPYITSKFSIDKIPAVLHASDVVISVPTTEHSGIWVGLVVKSSKGMVQNIQEMFALVLSAVKTYLGYLCFIFYQKQTRIWMKELYHLAIQLIKK